MQGVVIPERAGGVQGRRPRLVRVKDRRREGTVVGDHLVVDLVCVVPRDPVPVVDREGRRLEARGRDLDGARRSGARCRGDESTRDHERRSRDSAHRNLPGFAS